MAHPQPYPALTETPVQLADRLLAIHLVIVINEDPTDAVNVKIYHGPTAPDVATAEPAISLWCPANDSRTYPLFVDMPSPWIAAAIEAGPGATAPSTAARVTVVRG